MERIESQYPINSRKEEIERIFSCIKKRMSAQLISIPGAGRSTVLRLLSYNKKLRQHYLGETEEHHIFVYVNFSEIANFEPADIFKFILVNLLFATNNKKEINDQLHSVFHDVLLVKDPVIFFQHFKHAMEILSTHNYTTVFLLDRFSEFTQAINDIFFLGLKSLRIAASEKLSVVFSVHRPLAELLAHEYFKSFNEYILGNDIYMRLKDEVTTDFRIQLLEQQLQSSLPVELKNELYHITGGHSKLMRLGAQVVMQQDIQNISKENLSKLLEENILISSALADIWHFLSAQEQQSLKSNTPDPMFQRFHLPFPMFSLFIKQYATSTTPREIRIDPYTKDIFYGNDIVAGLTAHEHRLLSFFIANANRVCEREEIIQSVWKENKTLDGVTDEALDQMVHRLRRKIEDEPDNPRHIITVKGRGFRFIP